MKKIIVFSFFLLQSIISLKAIENKEWTVLIYMSADDTSYESIMYNIKQLSKVGSTAALNVIVYLTMKHQESIKKTRKLYLEKGELRKVGPSMYRDSGDFISLSEGLLWAALDYPSDHLCVVLLGSGTGVLNRDIAPTRGLCFDADSGNCLTEKDFFYTFSWFCNNIRSGKKIDVIVGDAPFLCSLEMACTLSSFAHYFVGSQGNMMQEGLRYADIFAVQGQGKMTPCALTQLMVNTYEKTYSANEKCLLSVIKLQDIELLVANLNAIAQVLLSHLKGKNGQEVKMVLKKCISRRNCPSFDEGRYIDLLQFYKNILQNISDFKLSKSVSQQFRQTIIAGISLFPQIIKGLVVCKRYKKSIGGLSIYFSRHSLHSSYYGLHWTGYHSNWVRLLEGFVE